MVTNASVKSIADQLLDLENDLITRINSDKIGINLKESVAYVYNPLDYAANLHEQYIQKYCNTPKKVLFLGMNPGPNGMCQTGVPFGEVNAVRDFLKINGNVRAPKTIHPKRPILGMKCHLSEPSGKRLWGLIKQISGNPDNFFKYCCVHNYCPLALFSKSGANITPDDLKSGEKALLNGICDEFLYKTLKLLNVETVVAIGRYAEKRTLETLKTYDNKLIKVVEIHHPSPRNKHSSQNWDGNVAAVLETHEIIQCMKGD